MKLINLVEKYKCKGEKMQILKKAIKILLIVIIIVVIIAVLFIKLWQPFGRGISAADKEVYGQKTDLFYNGIFHGDPEISIMNDNESEFGDDEQLTPKDTLPVNHLDSIPDADINDLKWVWFGHSSSMLQMQGLNILIDPVFSDYASPVSGFGPKRFSEIPIDPQNLPMIDVLVISHDHYDHLDYATIKDIDEKVKAYCVPLGVENHLIRWGVDESKIHSMAWYDETKVDGLKIIATPGRHYTGRLPWQNNTTLWSGFVFKSDNYQAYYTGDTGYGDHFKEIYEKFGAMDFIILENGQYDKSWEAIHLLPDQGIQVAKDLKAKWIVPVHWGTFSISYHAWDDPIKQITALASQQGINVATPLIGQIVDFNSIEQFQNQWWLDVE